MSACLDWLLLEVQHARTVSSRHSSPLELLDLTRALALDLATPRGSTARLARVSRLFVALLIYLGIQLEAALEATRAAILEATLEATMVLTLPTLPQLPQSMK
jgi:hypothetical protein